MKKLIAVATAGLALLALGCWSDVGEEPLPPTDWSASPDAVLSAVEKSFNERDHGLLKYSLDHDAFVFYFNPADVGERVGNYIIPESWSYAEFVSACGNMFDEVYSISMGISAIGAPPAGATAYTAENVTFDFVVMATEDFAYRADKGYFNFHFRKGADGKWRLAKWWDYSIAFDGSGRGAPSTFGRILVIFR